MAPTGNRALDISAPPSQQFLSTTTIASSAAVNEIFWMTSLHDSERGLSNRIIEDLEVYFATINFPFQCFEPKDGGEFFRSLDQLADRARQGAKPIIHLDMHGDAKKGLYIATSNEFVAWDRIIKKFRSINIYSANNLIVVSGACFSAHLLLNLSFFEPVPFYAFFAPGLEIDAGSLEDGLLAFYRDLFSAADLNAALPHLSPKIKFYHCKKLLFLVLAGYVKRYCFGKGGRKRLENLMTTTKESLRKSGQPLKHWRAFARKHLIPKPQLVSDAEITFLIGKQAGFTIDAVVKVAQASLFEDQRRAAEGRRREKQRQRTGRR